VFSQEPSKQKTEPQYPIEIYSEAPEKPLISHPSLWLKPSPALHVQACWPTTPRGVHPMECQRTTVPPAFDAQFIFPPAFANFNQEVQKSLTVKPIDGQRDISSPRKGCRHSALRLSSIQQTVLLLRLIRTRDSLGRNPSRLTTPDYRTPAASTSLPMTLTRTKCSFTIRSSPRAKYPPRLKTLRYASIPELPILFVFVQGSFQATTQNENKPSSRGARSFCP